jgi:hypothetical protein
VNVVELTNEPEVPAIVTVEVVAAGAVSVALLFPHPEIMPNPTVQTSRSSQIRTWRRLRSPSKPSTAPANVAPGTQPRGPCIRAEKGVVVVTVRLVLIAPEPVGATIAGENVHPASVGSPVHAKLTFEVNPFCGVNVTVNVPLEPRARDRDPGAAASVNPCGGRLIR